MDSAQMGFFCAFLGLIATGGAIICSVGFAYFIMPAKTNKKDNLLIARLMEIGGFAVYFTATISCIHLLG